MAKRPLKSNFFMFPKLLGSLGMHTDIKDVCMTMVNLDLQIVTHNLIQLNSFQTHYTQVEIPKYVFFG